MKKRREDFLLPFFYSMSVNACMDASTHAFPAALCPELSTYEDRQPLSFTVYEHDAFGEHACPFPEGVRRRRRLLRRCTRGRHCGARPRLQAPQ